jgi:hypothetical protein
VTSLEGRCGCLLHVCPSGHRVCYEHELFGVLLMPGATFAGVVSAIRLRERRQFEAVSGGAA